MERGMGAMTRDDLMGWLVIFLICSGIAFLSYGIYRGIEIDCQRRGGHLVRVFKAIRCEIP